MVTQEDTIKIASLASITRDNWVCKDFLLFSILIYSNSFLPPLICSVDCLPWNHSRNRLEKIYWSAAGINLLYCNFLKIARSSEKENESHMRQYRNPGRSDWSVYRVRKKGHPFFWWGMPLDSGRDRRKYTHHDQRVPMRIPTALGKCVITFTPICKVWHAVLCRLVKIWGTASR